MGNDLNDRIAALEAGKPQPTTITTSTRVTISVVATIAGGAFWLAAMYSQLTSMKNEITELRGDVSRVQSEQRIASERTTRLETQFGYIQQSLEDIKKGLEKIKGL